MKKKVLLVEDNIFLSDLYLDVLKDLNVKVEVARDGHEAYKMASKGGWDLILMDVIMPGIDGFEVVQRLIDNPPPKPNKSIVYWTNLDNQHELDQAKKLGDGYIMKGEVTPDELIKKIEPFLK